MLGILVRKTSRQGPEESQESTRGRRFVSSVRVYAVLSPVNHVSAAVTHCLQILTIPTNTFEEEKQVFLGLSLSVSCYTHYSIRHLHG